MITIPPTKDVQVPSPGFNWVKIVNRLGIAIDIELGHDEIMTPIIAIYEATEEDEELAKRIQEIKEKEIKQ